MSPVLIALASCWVAGSDASAAAIAASAADSWSSPALIWRSLVLEILERVQRGVRLVAARIDGLRALADQLPERVRARRES